MTEELVSIFPSICADHDEEKYHIEIELPGVKKEDIELEMSDESFFIKASGGYSHTVSGTDNWAAGGLFQDS